MSGKPNQVSNMHRNRMPGTKMVRVKKKQRRKKRKKSVIDTDNGMKYCCQKLVFTMVILIQSHYRINLIGRN